MRFLMTVVATALVMALLGGTALAQEAAGGDTVAFKKRTIIDFSDVIIEGELTKPEGSYIVNRKISRFSTLMASCSSSDSSVIGRIGRGTGSR